MLQLPQDASDDQIDSNNKRFAMLLVGGAIMMMGKEEELTMPQDSLRGLRAKNSSTAPWQVLTTYER